MKQSVILNAATMFFKGIYDSWDKDDKENV